MKILVFTTQFHLLGGAERLAVELAEDLNKRHIHADILSMYDENTFDIFEKKQELLQMGIPAIHFLGLNINPSFVGFIFAVFKLWQMIRLNSYDVVETSQSTPTIIAAWATKFTRSKHVAGLHHIGTDKEKRILPFIISAKLNPETYYYGVSQSVVGSWLHNSSTFVGRLRVIYNSISDNSFHVSADNNMLRSELEISISSRIVLFVGRIDAYKGFETVLEALEAIVLQEDLVLLFVGHKDPSANKILAAVKQKIAHQQLGDRVRFLGRRNDIPRLMACSDVLAHPARTEAFGLVLAEAMAAGLPLVASNVDGIPEVLAGTDSIMIPPDDSDALRDSVLKILSWTPEEKLKAIEKGNRRAEDFKMVNRTKAMILFFQDALEQHC